MNLKEQYDILTEKTTAITINKSETADTRTCDFKNVDVNTLLKSSKSHISDVNKGIDWFISKLKDAGDNHDHTKIEHIDMFHKDFTNGFKTQKWYDLHKKQERHHISVPEGRRDDIDLVDVIEFLIDGVMAGLARSGEYRKEDLPNGILETAFNNTIDKLIKDITVNKG